MAPIFGLILHLSRATARRDNVVALRKSLPFPSEICAAVDAQTLTAQAREAYVPQGLWDPRYPFGLNDTEIAVFLSYRAAWQRIVQSDQDAGFVVEDDVALTAAAFARAWNLAAPHIDESCWIRFPWKPRDRGGAALATAEDARMFRADAIGLGMQAQVFGRTTAVRLLELTSTFDRPVDAFLQMSWVTDMCPLVVWPSGVVDISDQLGGSTLSKHRGGIASRLMRDVRRLRYRRAIARYSNEKSPKG
ncbi:MAG: glycosyltransferase family 25 protein [Pseudomonadota bacterium]